MGGSAGWLLGDQGPVWVAAPGVGPWGQAVSTSSCGSLGSVPAFAPTMGPPGSGPKPHQLRVSGLRPCTPPDEMLGCSTCSPKPRDSFSCVLACRKHKHTPLLPLSAPSFLFREHLGMHVNLVPLCSLSTRSHVCPRTAGGQSTMAGAKNNGSLFFPDPEVWNPDFKVSEGLTHCEGSR